MNLKKLRWEDAYALGLISDKYLQKAELVRWERTIKAWCLLEQFLHTGDWDAGVCSLTLCAHEEIVGAAAIPVPGIDSPSRAMASADPAQPGALAPVQQELDQVATAGTGIGAEHPRLCSKQGFGNPFPVLKPLAKQTTSSLKLSLIPWGQHFIVPSLFKMVLSFHG